MHYADDKEVKVGDLAISSPPYPNSTELIGTVVAGTATSDSCNLQILPFAVRVKSSLGTGEWHAMHAMNPWCVTAKECHRVDVP